MALTALLVTVRPSVPEIAAILGIHTGLLAVLFTTVVAAMGLRSTSLVNLVVLAFLGQVLLFLTTTLPDALPTEIVLIVTGLVMLGIGLALERGRRQVLDRIEQ
ncbi:MAG: hypothetical protein U5K37_00205 [Natrialbaceae archaeon]|nr:hypothetical protein [Natrialbaceae archaeon]